MTYLTVRKIQGEPLLFWRNNTGAGVVGGRWLSWGSKGSPDILCCHRGRMVGIECKSSTGKQSPEQKLFQQLLLLAGGSYILARSVDDVRSAMGEVIKGDSSK